MNPLFSTNSLFPLLVKWLVLSFIFIEFTSCSEPPPLKLTSTQRTEVDTLYLRIVNPLGKQLDSICEANRAGKILYLIDSMRNIRLSEEEKLRLKYLKNEKK
jgi:hypothetical protein